MRWFSLTLLIGCVSFDPYEGGRQGGGAWLTPALEQGFTISCAPPDPTAVGPNIGDLARDFRLYDQFAYRVNLHDFCEHTVLITVSEMGNTAAEDTVASIPSIVDSRLPSATSDSPFIALTTWHETADGEVPTRETLRIYAEELGIDPQDGTLDGQKVPMLLDEPRFAGAAAAAAVQWAATDVSHDLPGRLQIEREVAGRWPLRTTPFYVVLHPGLQIAACGVDLKQDQILEAVEFPPSLFTLQPAEDGGDPSTRCSRRTGR